MATKRSSPTMSSISALPAMLSRSRTVTPVNYRFSRGLATAWSKGAQKQIDQMAAARRKREIASIDDARAVRDVLQAAAPVTISAKVGGNGRLRAVSTSDIAEAVKAELGQTIDRRRVVIASPIKTTGDYTVVINLHNEVTANLKVRVVAAK